MKVMKVMKVMKASLSTRHFVRSGEASQFPLGPGSKSGKQNGEIDSNANKPCKLVRTLSFVDEAESALGIVLAPLSSMHESFSAFLAAFIGFRHLAFSFQKAWRVMSVANQWQCDFFLRTTISCRLPYMCCWHSQHRA